MSKITYLLGAGASANALPVVKNIPQKLALFRNFIHDNRSGLNDILDGGKSIRELEDEFLHECDEIIDLLNKKFHASIDTYAKRLRLTSPHTQSALKKYKRLKGVLSTFFIHEQLNNPVDYRYDSFLASILGDSHTDFPKNLNILTWNYDFQFEKAYSTYSGKSRISENQSELMVFESGRYWMDIGNFGIFKLNGTTNTYKIKDGRPNLNYLLDDFIPKPNKEQVEKYIRLYNNVLYKDSSVRSSLSFAWESDWENETRNFIEKTLMAIRNTEILVVIGYSFPFFNRGLDKKIFQSFGDSLKRIYIQDTNSDAVAESVESILPDLTPISRSSKVQIIQKSSVEQFFLPPEL